MEAIYIPDGVTIIGEWRSRSGKYGLVGYRDAFGTYGYRGTGCGGACLPFQDDAQALSYFAERAKLAQPDALKTPPMRVR